MAALIAYLRSPRYGPTISDVGVDDQRRAVQAWANKKRHLIETFFEDDSSAGSFEKRPGLVEAMAALHERKGGLVVDRLASLDNDLVVQEQLLAELRRMGARVYSLSAEEMAQLRRTPSDPSRHLVRQVLQAVEKNEPSMTALRAASRNGSRPAGSPPYGFRVEDGELVFDPAEQQAVARIAELRSGGATLREIARRLDAEGHGAKRATRWHPEAVRRVLIRLTP
jgi:DNA invertase Pin-like site-specific DNA recombinase